MARVMARVRARVREQLLAEGHKEAGGGDGEDTRLCVWYEHPHHATEGLAHVGVVAHEARDGGRGDVEGGIVRGHLVRVRVRVKIEW